MTIWSERRVRALEDHIASAYTLLPYNADVARQWAGVVAACSRGGFTPGQNDAWVAATALTFGCPVVSGDRAFRRMAEHYPALDVLP